LLCRQHRMLPTPYKLEGVVREGGHSKCISRVVEVWKGRYKNEVVALKVLKVPSQGPQMLAFEGVSTPRDPQRMVGSDILTAVLRGSSARETG